MCSPRLFTPTFHFFYTDISAISVTFRNSGRQDFWEASFKFGELPCATHCNAGWLAAEKKLSKKWKNATQPTTHTQGPPHCQFSVLHHQLRNKDKRRSNQPTYTMLTFTSPLKGKMVNIATVRQWKRINENHKRWPALKLEAPPPNLVIATVNSTKAICRSFPRGAKTRELLIFNRNPPGWRSGPFYLPLTAPD